MNSEKHKRKVEQLLFPIFDDTVEHIDENKPDEIDEEQQNMTNDKLEEDTEFINVYKVPKKFRDIDSNNYKLLLE